MKLPLPLKAMIGHYRNHPWQLLLMWVGIAVGVATIIAVELLNDSARRSIIQTQQALYPGATHLLEGDPVTLEGFYRRLLREVPGVRAMPILSVPLSDPATGQRIELWGIDPFSLSGFSLPVGQPSGEGIRSQELIRYPNGLYLSANAARALQWSSSQERVLLGPRGEHRLRLLGTLPPSQGGDASSAPLAIMDIGPAMEIFKETPELSQVWLKLGPKEQQALRALLPADLNLASLADQTQQLLQMRNAFELSLNALSAMALLMGLFLVYNSSHFGFLQRQPLLAQLRALGVSNREISHYLVVEYALLSATASVFAVPLGWLLALQLGALMDSGLMASDTSISLVGGNLPLALGIGCGASFGACLIPFLSSPGASPRPFGGAVAAHPDDNKLPHWQLPAALCLLLVALLLLMLPGTPMLVSYGAITSLLLGSALLAPLLVRGLLIGAEALWAGRVQTWGWQGLLILRETLGNLSRTRVALSALMVAVATSFGMQLMIHSFRDSVEQWLEQRLNAPLYLRMSAGPERLRPSIPPALLSELKAMPDMDEISEVAFESAWVRDRKVELIVGNFPPPAQTGYRLLEDNGLSPWPQLETRATTLISEPLAYHLQLGVGERLKVRLHGHPMELEVIAIFQDYGSEQGRLLVSNRLYERYYSKTPASALGLYTTLDSQSLYQKIPKRWKNDVDIINQSALRSRSLAVFDQTFAITSALQLLAVVVAFMGLFASLLAILLERRHHLRAFHQLGLSAGERAGLLLSEGAIIGFCAGLLAIPCGEALAWMLLKAINLKAFGWNLYLTQHSALWLQPIALAGTAALLASLYPAWRVTRPLGATQEDE
ncbi:ABC transporter permease [Aestuariirhabdus litorea]|uniref:Uncharacterized protein n=1 Tax=Aestuariirhabdus litorea TaxID=2528527 RepID=A0A3P3VQL7_9GAMM|nr:ABC transporter permease [Aestuariirhabdus litorea]RRJ85025.1 hypothetical protein D0544_08090 [Aestuariirhabdus litorea]RWW98250.1 FtsX-like permease family protein [Endozoicomonadaceae bacterium GTF-13]